MFSVKHRIPPVFRLVLLTAALSIMGIMFSCDSGKDRLQSDEPKNSSPTEAYKRLFVAVKAKDTEAIKQNLTKRSIDLGQMMVDRKMKETLDQALENGLTATTLSATMPTIRDERINGNFGAVEVWNSKDSKWEDLPFMLEDGSWKLAWGEQFAGTFISPGKGRDTIEKEAANALSGTPPLAVDPASANAAVANAINSSKKK